METEKQIITLADIRKYLKKGNIYDIVCLSGLFPILFWKVFAASRIEMSIIALVFCISFLFGIGLCLYNIIKIRKNTYFHIQAAVLTNKADDIHTFLYGHETHRLYFRQGHYDMRVYGRYCGPDGARYSIYKIGTKTIYDTAFIGDSFTLICVGKRVHLAFNNNYFDIQNDL